MTSLTYVNFFTFIYGWIGFWCTFCSILMLSRRGKNWSDYDVISFRVAVGGVTVSVFANRVFNPLTVLMEPAMTPFLWFMVTMHTLLGYAAAATAIRVATTLFAERNHGSRS